MHTLKMILLGTCLTAGPLWTACPAAPDHSVDIDALIEAAQSATNMNEARDVSGKLWALWTDAPDEIAQTMLDAGMRKRQSYDFLGALEELNELVEYCPEYAEGYNQRAFVNFLRRDFAPALVDLDRAIELSPKHIAAISGRALTLLGLGRIDEARATLLEALDLNPWLSERALLEKGGALAPKGEEI